MSAGLMFLLMGGLIYEKTLTACCDDGFSVSCALAADLAYAGDDHGNWFTEKDWESVCDNGGTCRAAGYQSDESDNPVSVLFTRKAGAGRAADAKLSIVPVGEGTGGILYVNGRPLGKFDFSLKTGIVRPLSPKQADTLLAALRNKNAAVVFKGADGNVWNLSPEGARETLLKMDELQGCYDVPDAPIQRGCNSRTAAKSQLPVVRPVIPVKQKPRKGSREYALIDKAVGKYFSNSNPNVPCSATNEPYTVYPLSEKQVLVERSCWQAAYNGANYYGIFSRD
ncbi:hypothetical protein AABM17_1569 [Neisseria musculi]|uniref:DUF1176 domain-containing protein n=1 Tax=Neisseria musculi TaxID=1815583 RepID=A0A7H1MDE0_9NEIS|nr:hypothetical protein H7A79_1569 [Neisseria musculi]